MCVVVCGGGESLHSQHMCSRTSLTLGPPKKSTSRRAVATGANEPTNKQGESNARGPALGLATSATPLTHRIQASEGAT